MAFNNDELFNRLTVKIHKHYPDIKIKYMDDDWRWRLIPKSIRPYGYSGINTIWLKQKSFSTQAHEYAHLVERRQVGRILWFFSYLSPQSNSIFWLGFLLLALGFNLTAFIILCGVTALLNLLPWQSPSRAHHEMTGYVTNMLISKKVRGKVTDKIKLRITNSLTAWMYYKMLWRKKTAARLVEQTSLLVESNYPLSVYNQAHQDLMDTLDEAS